MITNLIREKRKTLSIIISREGELIVKAPKNLPLNEIMDFVKSKEKWISSKQSEIKENLNQNKTIIDYNKILYLGNEFECVFLDNIKEVSIADGKLLIPQKYAEKKKKYVGNWLKNKANLIVENRLLYFASNYHLHFNKLEFVNAKTKWGSCSEEKELCFNWRLVMLSPKLIDYVIVHELAHLIELNHSANFWKLVEAIMPDYKERRAKLKKCGFLLNLFR